VDGTGWAGVRGRARSHRYSVFLQLSGSLWERACPRSRRRGGWHRLRRCSRARPLPQVQRIPSADGVAVGAGMPAKQAARWMAPATPVFAGAPAPTGTAYSFSCRGRCGSGHAREAGGAVDGTGWAGVRGRARSHRYSVFLQLTGSLWEQACPRSRRRGGWHRLGRCSRARPLPQVQRIPSTDGVAVGAGMPAKQATRCMALWSGQYADAERLPEQESGCRQGCGCVQ